MNLGMLHAGLDILQNYANSVELDVVPNSFPNGAPDHSHHAFIAVSILDDDVSDEDAEQLRKLGWVPECNGDYWCLYNTASNRIVIGKGKDAIVVKA